MRKTESNCSGNEFFSSLLADADAKSVSCFPAFFTHVFRGILPIAVVRDLGIYTPIGSACVELMFLILLQIGDDLVDPFGDEICDVPMTAMCRTVEIDLLQMLGELAPDPITTDNGVLW